jgi:hypothetical protein
VKTPWRMVKFALCSALPFSLPSPVSGGRGPFRSAQEGEFLVKLFFKKVVLKRADLQRSKFLFFRKN